EVHQIAVRCPGVGLHHSHRTAPADVRRAVQHRQRRASRDIRAGEAHLDTFLRIGVARQRHVERRIEHAAQRFLQRDRHRRYSRSNAWSGISTGSGWSERSGGMVSGDNADSGIGAAKRCARIPAAKLLQARLHISPMAYSGRYGPGGSPSSATSPPGCKNTSAAVLPSASRNRTAAGWPLWLLIASLPGPLPLRASTSALAGGGPALYSQ